MERQTTSKTNYFHKYTVNYQTARQLTASTSRNQWLNSETLYVKHSTGNRHSLPVVVASAVVTALVVDSVVVTSGVVVVTTVVVASVVVVGTSVVVDSVVDTCVVATVVVASSITDMIIQDDVTCIRRCQF